MKVHRALLFDLDDTLYLEENFVRSGFSAVAAMMAPRLGIDETVLLDRLWYDFRRLGRTQIFDRFLKVHTVEGIAIKDLVACYRNAPLRISLIDGVQDILVQLRQRFRLAIVTDGLESIQRAKIAALGLENKVDAVVYPWALGKPKPDPDGYLEACRLLGVRPTEVIIVGDDPYHDIEAAYAAGISAIRVLNGKTREVATQVKPARYVEITALEQLETAIEQITRL